jgi:DNA processing protein
MAPDTDELAAWLALASLAATGTTRWRDLVEQLGSARAAIFASDDELDAAAARGATLTRRGRAALRSFDEWDTVRRVRSDCAERNIGIVTYADADYPELLKVIPDPPLALYWRGCVPPAEVTPAIAMVGARRATRYGLRTARRMSAAIAEAGVWVVSGLAIGIDGAAHEGALETGRTAAVLAGGVDRCFPASHRRLASRIVETGVVLSEVPPGTPTLPHQFPIRNRIITGLAKVTVIVEAQVKGGSLISARWATAQGRDVFAVPGPVDAPASAGTNALLRDGAGVLLEPDDALLALGLACDARDGRDGRDPGLGLTPPADPVFARVFEVLSDDPLSADEIAVRCGLDETLIMEKLTGLELDGLAERLPGGTYVRSSRVSEPTERS